MPKKLTENQKNKIFQLQDKGWDSQRIADKVGATRQQVAAILAHRTMGTYS